MKILFLPKYTEIGASSRYRTYQFISFFKSKEIDCDIKPFFTENHFRSLKLNKRSSVFYYFKRLVIRFLILFKVRKYDLLFIEKEFIPYFPAIPEWILKALNVKYILDYDDAVFHNYDKSNNRIIKRVLANKIPKAVKWSSAVIGGSNYLINYAKKFNSEVYYIPTVVDFEKYKNSFDIEINHNKFIIGWMGSSTTSKYLNTVFSEIDSFLKENKDAELWLVGYSNEGIVLPQQTKVIQWEAEKEIEYLNSFTVGISPLDDGYFERGKCAFKSIQYMAVGKPVVTSPVGANGDVIVDGLTGFHAIKKGDWEKALKRLSLDFDIRKKMGLEGRKRVESHFSFDAVKDKYIEIFNKIAYD